MKRASGMSIPEYLNSLYVRKAPLLPESLRDKDTDDFLAWKIGRVPVKARGSWFSFLIVICGKNLLINICRTSPIVCSTY